eukprot:1034869-Alexandrium_andersonii.AAC.1
MGAGALHRRVLGWRAGGVPVQADLHQAPPSLGLLGRLPPGGVAPPLASRQALGPRGHGWAAAQAGRRRGRGRGRGQRPREGRS